MGEARHYVITLHGTGDGADSDRGPKWWQVGDHPFSRKLQVLCTEKGWDFMPFRWSGANSQLGRLKAAESLAAAVNRLGKDTSVSFVSHSHGGNVFLNALGTMRKPHERIASSVLVGTPPLTERKSFVDLLFFLIGVLTFIISFLTPFFIVWLVGRDVASSTESVWLEALLGNPVLWVPACLMANLLAFLMARWVAASSRRFSVFATILTLLFLAFVANVWATDVFDGELGWSDENNVLIFLSFYFFSNWTVAAAASHRGINAFRRRRRKTRALRCLKCDVVSVMHPMDEVLGLLTNLRGVKVRLASPEIMTKAVAGLLLMLMLTGSLIALGIFMYANSNEDVTINPFALMALVFIILVAPFYILTRTVSNVAGGFVSFISAASLNRRITNTAVAAAFGSDSPNDVEFDDAIWQDGLCHHKFDPAVSDAMLNTAAERAEITASKLVRRGITHRLQSPDLLGEITNLITFKELMHCGYFENEQLVDEVLALLAEPRSLQVEAPAPVIEDDFPAQGVLTPAQ